ncbi:MAG: NDP-sugar synthase [Armatimonas sp.]
MILGAGVGSRLDPLTRSLPKPAVPLVGKPVIGHLCDLLRRNGFDEIVINVQYLADKLVETVGNGDKYGVKITYAHEDKLWGDAGGLKRVEDFFAGEKQILVIGGDDLTDMDIAKVVAVHHEKGATATIGVTPVEETREFGVAVMDSEGIISSFQEKPAPEEAKSNLANTGIYVFHPKVLDFIPPATFYGLGKDVLPGLLTAGERLVGVPSGAYWKDVGSLPVYRQSQRDILDGVVYAELPVGAVREGNVVVCQGAQVAGVAEGYTIVGEGAIIEPGARVVDSILWDGAIVRAGSYLENCIVGSGVSVACSHGAFGGIFVEKNRPQS